MLFTPGFLIWRCLIFICVQRETFVAFSTASKSQPLRASTTYSCIDWGILETSLAAFGLNRKPHVAKSRKWHSSRMRPKKKIHWDKAGSALQKTFVRQVSDLMSRRGLSDNDIARALYPEKPTKIQSSISRITSCRQDPTLEKVQQFALALGVAPLELLVDDAAHKVEHLSSYPDPFSEESKLRTKSRQPKRKRV